ncbi:MAG: hypothetical protein WCS15_03300 [Prevotella sp.]|nr:hypothetical protein [Prevotella sp.]
MKKDTLLYSFIAMLMLLVANGCTPDEYSLGEKDYTPEQLAEGSAYTIEHDASNPNIVYVKSLVPSSYQVLWESPQGRTQGSDLTLKIPFAGNYKVRMGVQTRGGIVYGPEATFTIDNFYAGFIDDPLWNTLTGGAGNSKKWYLDVDETSTCRYFAGPMYFYGTADNWNSVMLGEKIGGDSWNWSADWAGNGSWLFGSTGAMDYGYMEFGLSGNATVKVVDNAVGKTYNGTFQLNTEKHTISMTDAPVLHDPSHDAIVTKWGEARILSMDNDHLQLAVLRDNSSEGPCLLSFNFISEDYKKNWTPKK